MFVDDLFGAQKPLTRKTPNSKNAQAPNSVGSKPEILNHQNPNNLNYQPDILNPSTLNPITLHSQPPDQSSGLNYSCSLPASPLLRKALLPIGRSTSEGLGFRGLGFEFEGVGVLW